MIGRRATLFIDLLLRSEEFSAAQEPAAAQLLAREVVAGTCPLKQWDNAVEQWLARVNFVAAQFPEMEFPRIDTAAKLLLLEQICQGAASYKEIKDRPVWPIVRSWLNGGQQKALDDLAPERIKLAGGRAAKITYTDDGSPPTIAAQSGFIRHSAGPQYRTRRIRSDQVLAPNHRPIQITNDLETFWREVIPG